MSFTLDDLLASPIPRLADLMTRSFEDYLVPMRFTPESMAGLLLSDGVSLSHSRIVLKEGEPAGVGLIARRGWACRLAHLPRETWRVPISCPKGWRRGCSKEWASSASG